MPTDTPGSHFYYHLVAVLQCHFVLLSAATISPKFCEMFHVDDSYFADGGIFFYGRWRNLVKTEWGRGSREVRHLSIIFPPRKHCSQTLLPPSLLSFEEVLHGLSNFLVFNLCCAVLFGPVVLTTAIGPTPPAPDPIRLCFDNDRS